MLQNRQQNKIPGLHSREKVSTDNNPVTKKQQTQDGRQVPNNITKYEISRERAYNKKCH